MKKPVEFDVAAQAELRAALDWYAAQAPVLEGLFAQEIASAIDALASPSRHAFAIGVAPELNVRRVLLHRFPYALVFVELPNSIRVLAVMHQRQRPGYWKTRT